MDVTLIPNPTVPPWAHAHTCSRASPSKSSQKFSSTLYREGTLFSWRIMSKMIRSQEHNDSLLHFQHALHSPQEALIIIYRRSLMQRVVKQTLIRVYWHEKPEAYEEKNVELYTWAAPTQVQPRAAQTSSTRACNCPPQAQRWPRPSQAFRELTTVSGGQCCLLLSSHLHLTWGQLQENVENVVTHQREHW